MKPADKDFKLNMGSLFLKGFIFLLLVIVLRFVAYLSGPPISLSWILAGLWQDIIAASTWIVVCSPFYIFIIRFFKKTANVLLSIWLSLGLAFQILMIIYFSISNTALRVEHIYGMTESQVDILLDLYGFSWYYLFLLLPLIIGIHFLLNLSKQLEGKKIIEIPTALVIVIGSSINIFWPIQEVDYNSDLEFEIKSNKAQHFLKSYFNYEATILGFSDDDLKQSLETYYSINKIEKADYYEYPFFNPQKSKNHLESYFIESDTSPNIVVIIAESLAKIFSGENARLGSFTPFLDSLQDHSLYFENCLANAERTFGAIPNIVAGVPEGDRGFMNLRSSMPEHLSLPMLLKENEGYQTNFYCGARKDYDFMNEYLMFQKFDEIYGEADFSRNEIMGELEFEKGDVRDFNWGAEDVKVFDESMSFLEASLQNQPFFNLYLTTSFHGPFAYTGQSKFRKLAKTRIDHSNYLDKSSLIDEVETLAALMYMDDAIRKCIENYKQRDDFDNTIFVILGDHGTKILSENSRIEKYHVPLFIYSPLLKKSGHFKNVMCQKDIASALQALLRDNFKLNLPEFSISQSNNIFNENAASFPLMYADKRLENYYHKGEFMVEDKLYALSSQMVLEESFAGTELSNEIQDLMAAYKKLAVYSCYENKLVPDEILNAWTKKASLFFIDDNLDQPYTGNHASAVYQNVSRVTEGKSYSGTNAIVNEGLDFLGIIQNELISSAKRVRLKMSFKIKCTDDQLPVLYVTETKEGEEDILKSINLSNEFGFLREIEKEGWFEFEFSLWFDNGGKNNVDRSLSIHMHKANLADYYLDDLKIELDEF